MNTSRHISRRTVLKGVGTVVALPFLEAMMPLTALAGRNPDPVARRLAFAYVPNGILPSAWKPKGAGDNYELSPLLQQLSDLRSEFTVYSGLAQTKADANGDGGGDHARAMATYLTCCQARKTSGADIRIGVSIDQVAAEQVGSRTRFPSLELGCDKGPHAGNCDSGYSCAYSNNISWKTESTPMPKEVDPRVIFERLFGGDEGDESEAARATRRERRASVLDYVLEDARKLDRQLGASDRRKVDEYLSSVREIETRLSRQEKDGAVQLDVGAKPTGIPADFGEHIRMVGDLLVLAFQGDLTRIATFVFANEGSNRSYSFLGVPEGHHDMTHHFNNPEKQKKVEKINTFHIEQFAYFLKKMRDVKEGDGTLLDQSMIVYGSGISDGNKHDHVDLPILVAGKGGGTLPAGTHLRCRNAPAGNLWLSLLDRIDARLERIGDSTGRLKELS